MKANAILPNDMPTRVLADAKLGAAQAPNNNLMNLFELPVLFYVAASALLAGRQALGDPSHVCACIGGGDPPAYMWALR